MTNPKPLQVDREQIARFVNALFRYADPGGFVSLRAFYDDANEVFAIQTHRLSDNTWGLIDAAATLASRAARCGRPVVFAPPIATFSQDRGATEADLQNGLTLSVECDQAPNAARQKLESLLGPATIVVASGGEWPNPDTGEIEFRLHLHWRLTEPTRDQESHALLKCCRSMASDLVGGDGSNKPAVHPIRWPGSWHRKGAPRLARIVAETESDLDLGEAEQRLRDAWKVKEQARASKTPKQEPAKGEPREMAELIAAILTGADYHTPLTVLAMRYLTAGMADGQVVLTLRGIMRGVPEPVRDTKDGTVQKGRWQARYDEIPRAVSTARVKISRAQATTDEPPDPVDFLADDLLTGSPALAPAHLPAALAPFVFDTAARMGTDPTAVAVGALVTCASVTHERWRVQPKRHDHAWTEAARIWGAIVGDPSILKSPVISACTSPVARLEMHARKLHADVMAQYKADAKALQDRGGDPASLGPAPRCPRFLVEDTSVEALSEVLRDDEKAQFVAPTGRVLIRQDEMGEFIAKFDCYRSGGRGGGDRGAYLRLYNGGISVIDRVGRGSFTVPSWSACLLGGIQPEPIQRIAREAADDGLLQRFIYCVPAGQGDGLDRPPDSAAIDRYGQLVDAISKLTPRQAACSRAAGTTDDCNAAVLVLDDEAHRHREEVNRRALAVKSLPDSSARLRAALGKWPGLFARLCLLYHLIDHADAGHDDAAGMVSARSIPETTAAQVAHFMQDILLPHLLRAEAVMFDTVQTGHARWIAGFILSKRTERLTLRDLVQAYRPLRAPERRRELFGVMESLVALGWLQHEPRRNPARGPSAWLVNQAVYTKFGERAEAERAARAAAQQAVSEKLRQRGRQSA